MTNQDFNKYDGEVLAEFAGLEVIDDSGEGGGPVWVEIDDDDIWDEYRVSGTTWFGPWLWTAPRWQTQLLFDAVREKCLEYETKFVNELTDVLLSMDMKTNGFGLASAPPEPVCKSILQLEGD